MKTLAIRLEDDLHAQLSAIAALEGVTITDEIRQAIERLLEAKRSDPALSQKASSVLETIEREARERQAAIAALFQTEDQPAPPAPAKPPTGRKA